MRKQRKRRLLAMLLSLTMLLGLVPGAYAQDGESGGLTWKQVDNSEVSAPLGREGAEETEEMPEETPLYGPNEQVRVSIVLEGEPALALYSLASEEADAIAYREELQAYQEAAAEAISEDALDSQPLDVVWNLTLAANIVSANIKYGQIEDIRDLDYVEDVILETRYEILGFPTEAKPHLAISTGMTNTVSAWNEGYTGAGMRIAVIDTGLDIYHQSFNNDAFLQSLGEAAETEGRTLSSYHLLAAEEIGSVLTQLNAYEKMPAVTAQDLYRNEKLPFCFNYVDGDLDVTHENDTQGDHGSHVAGIAAANRYLKQTDGSFVSAMDEVKMAGNAPDAQMLVMKVFGKGGGAYDSDYMAAIEDAVLLHCDSVNLSLGSPTSGMAFPAQESYQTIMDNLANTDTVVNISAGNSGQWAESTNVGYPYSDDVSFFTVTSPGSYTNSLTVASVENNGFISAGGIIVFGQSMGYTETATSDSSIQLLASMDTTGTGTDYEFIYLDTYGAPIDYLTLEEEGVDTFDKIILCNRGGGINFSDKANNAVEWGGAIAVIICNNVSGSLFMDPEGYRHDVPYVSLSLNDALFLKENAEKHTIEDGAFGDNGFEDLNYYTGTITIKNTPTMVPGTGSHETMSSFSSWGVPGDLSIKPEITAPGGAIWSLAGTGSTHNSYQSMSGTSMASPQMAGISALVKQYIQNNDFSGKDGLTDRALIQSLLMSTARPLLGVDENGGEYMYSILQQGAGMVDTRAAISADSYILMDSTATGSWKDGKVKAELGDGTTGSYTVKFTINNLDGTEHNYTLSADVFTQNVTSVDLGSDDGPMDFLCLDTATRPLNAAVSWTWNGKIVDTDKFYDFNGDGVVNLEDGNALLDVVTGKRTRDSLSHKDLLADFTTRNGIISYTGYEFLRKLNETTAVLTVPANGSVTVTASIALDPAAVEEMMALCPNGFYVEAYVNADSIATSEGALGTSHSIPVLGFYGNWTNPSMFERGSALEYYFDPVEGMRKNGVPYLFDGTYTSMFANRLMYMKTGDSTVYYYGGNPWIDDDEYLPERNAFSSTRGDRFIRWNYMPIRNGIGRLLIQNADDRTAIYKETDLGTVAAAYFFNGYWFNNARVASVSWDGTDKNGNALPEGTNVKMSLTLAPELYREADGSINWDALGTGASKTMTLTIDNTAPTLKNAAYDPAAKILTLTLQDNLYTAYAALSNSAGTHILDAKSPNQALDTKGQAITVSFDMSKAAGSAFKVILGDYANNQATYELTGEFDPGMDLSPGDDAYYFGYNQLRGEWIAYNKDCSEYSVIGYGLSTIAGDIDNAFLTAGAYARGYVFAYDDGGNLYAFPVDETTKTVGDGQWIAYGYKIYDMAYDGKDMYLSYNSRGNVTLGKVDLVSGEITSVGILHTIPDPDIELISCALAFDDEGNLYDLVSYQYYSEDWEILLASSLCRMDGVDLNTREKVADVDAIGDAFNWLTWDSAEDELVLSAGNAYFGEWIGYDLTSSLYTVNPETGESTLKRELTLEGQQITAMFTAPDGADKLPASTEATQLTISPRSLRLAPGSSRQLTALIRPWNLTDKTLTWSSSNPAVVSVDQSGNILALSAGTATVTVTSSAAPNLTDSCEIEVSNLDQQLNGLVWTEKDVNWATFPVTNPGSWEPVRANEERFASATMGEDGYLYAATLDTSANVSDLYRVNPDTYESTWLGTLGKTMGGLFTADLAPMPGTGHLLGLYGNYIMDIDPENPDELMAWDAHSFGAITYFIAAAYLNDDVIHDTIIVDYDEENDEYITVEGDWDVHVYALVDVYGGVLYFACSDEGPAWLEEFHVETEQWSDDLWYSSAVWAYNTDGEPTLFWSHYSSGVSSELYALALDGGYPSLMENLGSFGKNAWPVVGLMTDKTPDLPASAAAMLRSGDMTRLGSAQAMEAPAEMVRLPNDIETHSASVSNDSGSSVVNSSTGTAVVQIALNHASTNGLIKVEYNSKELKLLGVNGKATLNSANTAEDGKIMLAYAYSGAANAGTVVAELTFNSQTENNTSILLTTLEDGLNTTNTSESVSVDFHTPVYPTFPSWPTKPVNPSKPSESANPTEPTEPTEPAEPTEPTEPTGPVSGTAIEVPAAPTIEEVIEIIAPYKDVNEGDWYANYAAYMINSGLMRGTDADSFSPNAPLTRGMLVTILHRAAGLPASGSSSFNDVTSGSWYADGVAWAAANGLVNGDGDGSFRPDGNITRQELAVILWRFARLLGLSVAADGTTIPDFADRNEIASWAGEAMSWAYRTGIINGRDDSHLAPTDGASRAETAAMLVRFLNLVSNHQNQNPVA